MKIILSRYLLHLSSLQKELVGKNEALHTEIIERTQAEEALRQLSNELEQRVKHRTTELELTNKELQEFAYVVSHDLKAPPRGITRLSQWLVQDYAGAFDEQGREMVELLVGRVKRMDRLIDGILKYSRVGRIIREKEQIDLNSLVQEVIDMLAPPEHIHITIERDLPAVVGDTIRISQVFQNLISNAVKFMDKPEGKVMIRCVEEEAHWRFSVADNGPGIDEKHHERIFQIFQTLRPRDERESTGVGLAVVKKIVELHGGKIWVESSPGHGSMFSFTLPKN
jgi:signal transduction histidine kinase